VTAAPADLPAAKNPHPAIFLVLFTPFGASSGYVTVTLAYLLGANGLTAAAIAAIIAASVWPQTWKVFWAPLVDTTLNSKLWYVLGALGVGGAIIGASVTPMHTAAVPILTLLAVVGSIASTLTSMASETFMANLDDGLKGRASGWMQAGNFAGSGLGGGLALYLAQHVHAQWVSGAGLGLMCMACCLALPFMANPPRIAARPGIVPTILEVLRDVWAVIRSRAGLLVLFLMLLPIGTGAASNLWPVIAGEWRANADTVALVNGVASGVVSAIGCLVGGYVCDRMDRRTAYCLFGVLVAIVTVLMALAPRSPATFIGFTLLYTTLIGGCYAAYSAVVLEAIGRGAAATKFNLMASVSNIPLAMMTTFDGGVHDKSGSSVMLYSEAAIGVVAVVLFAIAALAAARLWRPAPAAI
jgi:PAT family beta-lactamase induction signal transducer AmpG